MDGAVQGSDSPSPGVAASLDATMELLQLRTSLPHPSSSPEPGSCSSPSLGAQLELSLPAAGWVSAAQFHGSGGFPACRVPELAGRGAQPTSPAGFSGRSRQSLCARGRLPAALPVPGSLPHSPWPQKRKSWLFPQLSSGKAVEVCGGAHSAVPLSCSPIVPLPPR